MIQFAAPEVFLLVALLALWLRGALWPRPWLGVLRLSLLLATTALLAQPWLPGEQDGRDVVLLVDRSRSLPPQSLDRAREFATELARELRPGDRLGLVTFGRKPAVERVPQAPFAWPDLVRSIDADGTDLAAAVAAGLSAIPPGRQGSLLLWSDGEHNGGDLEAALRQALRDGRRIDAHGLARAAAGDTAVTDLLVPAAVPLGEPFVISAVVTTSAAGDAPFRLLVGGEVVRSGTIALREGRNVLQFRRALPTPGLHEVALEVRRDGDPVPGNDRGLAVVRSDGPRRVLCVTPNGRADRLTRSLQAAGLEVVVAPPAAAPLSLAGLDGFRAVVLEDVPAGDLPPGALLALQTFVRDLGGGLLMTGGKASFGVGGYHQTPVEAVLPVTMELREEQRRFGLAMAIALDRSGSMQMDAGGVTKMQLADRGAATAVEMLTPLDAVAVLAVDSAAHVVVPLQSASAKQAIAAKVRTIESMGGGIYIGAALHAAAKQLTASSQQNRHIVLFADAADAEEPGDYRSFVPELVRAGVSVSVIGLGSPADTDAALLQEIAKLGNGRCHFVADPADLPRVFVQETIQVARSAIVEEPVALQARPGLRTLGDLPADVPGLGGYAIAWRRPRAELDLETVDEHKAPALCHWQCGLGRAAAFLGEVDGPLAGGLASWPGYADFFATLARWLCGGQTTGVFVQARRDGGEGSWRVEVEPELASQLDRAHGVVVAPDGSARELVLERDGETAITARLPLLATGVYRAALSLGTDPVPLPPLCLPYSPEDAPQLDPRAGERVLRRLCTATGGRLAPTVAEVLAGPRQSPGRRELGEPLAWLALALLLAEIAVRRFDLRWPRWLSLRWPARWARWRGAVAPAPAGAAPAAVPAAPPAAPVAAPPAPTPPAATPPAGSLMDALARAKQRGQR